VELNLAVSPGGLPIKGELKAEESCIRRRFRSVPPAPVPLGPGSGQFPAHPAVFSAHIIGDSYFNPVENRLTGHDGESPGSLATVEFSPQRPLVNFLEVALIPTESLKARHALKIHHNTAAACHPAHPWWKQERWINAGKAHIYAIAGGNNEITGGPKQW